MSNLEQPIKGIELKDLKHYKKEFNKDLYELTIGRGVILNRLYYIFKINGKFSHVEHRLSAENKYFFGVK